MKKIGIDARLYFQTGVGVYTRNLLHILQDLAPPDIEFYIYVMQSDSPRISFDNNNFIKREVTSVWHSFSEQQKFLKVLKKDKLDLMHFTYFSYPVRYKMPFVATVHDVTPLLFKTGKASTKNKLWYEIKFQAFKFVLKNQVTHSKAIITPTHTVKNQLVEIFGKKVETKIIALYEGIDYELAKIRANNQLKQLFSNPFFIYIGNFYPHKNVEKLVEAFSKTTIPQKLVLIGPENFFSDRLRERVEELKQQERILFYHNAKTEDLVFFYSHAEAIINPSLSEGFGLPLVEAIYFNLPILASNIEVFKELLGNNYLSFDPTSEESIQICLESSATIAKPNYSELKQKFSFSEMTIQTLALYRKLLTEQY